MTGSFKIWLIHMKIHNINTENYVIKRKKNMHLSKRIKKPLNTVGELSSYIKNENLQKLG